MHSQELYNLDTTEWGARFICSYLRRLEQQYTLIGLLLMEKDRTSFNEYLQPDKMQPDKIKKSLVWKEKQEKSRHVIEILKKRQHAIAKEIKYYLAADFWEIRNIPRPVIELRPDPEFLLDSQR